MQLDTVVLQRQVTITNDSKVTVGVSGTYNITFSAQMFHIANEVSTAEIWLRVNGNDSPTATLNSPLSGRMISMSRHGISWSI